MNRLQKLLSTEGFEGVRDVILESPCFQLDENGEVVIHVYVGITKCELLIATQEVVNYHQANLNPNRDLELDGIRLNSVVPLSRVRFYVIDDRSRKFAICSCIGEVKYYEQCNTPGGSDALWTNWLRFFRSQDDPRVFGYKNWDLLENIYSDKHHFKFIKRPFPFYPVESVACQTIETRRTNRQKEHPLVCYKNKKEDLASVKLKYDIEEYSTVNDRILMASTKVKLPIKSNSCSDIRKGCQMSQNVRKFTLFSLVYRFCHGDKDRAIYEFLEFYPRGDISVEILRIYAQILKYQYREASRSILGTYEDSLESEASITDVIAGYKAEEKSEPPVSDETLHLSPKKWALLRSRLIKTKMTGLPTLSQVVNDVLFQKCDNKSKLSNITGFSPYEVSNEMMLMTSELIVKITQIDVVRLQMKKVSPSMMRLLEHFRLLSETITEDILDDTKLITKQQLLIFYIKVAECCFQHGYLQTCESIIIGVTSPEVFGLIRYWIQLKLNAPKDLMSLYKMINIIFIRHRYLKHLRKQTNENKVRLPSLELFIQHAWDINPDMNRFQGYRDYSLPKGKVVKKRGIFGRVRSKELKPIKQKSSQNVVDNIVLKQKTSKIQSSQIPKNKTPNTNIPNHHQEKRSSNVPLKIAQNRRESTAETGVLIKQNYIAHEFCDQILNEALKVVNSESKLQDRESDMYYNVKKSLSQRKSSTNHENAVPVSKTASETTPVSPASIKKTDQQYRSDPEDSQYFSTLHRQNVASGRRLSLFADNIPDETEGKKEEEIKKFIENNLKTFRKRSILEDTYLGEQKDVEEASERRSSLSDTVFSNYETDKSRRPSFLEKLLHHDGEKSLLQNLFGNKNKEDISKKSDESLQNTRVKAPVEEVPPDNIPDETEEKKEEKITKFIENNLKTLRKRSILEDTYLGEQRDVEEAPERRSSRSDTVFSNYETDKSRRPSFLEKLLHHDGEKSLLQNLFGKKSKEDISKKSDESLQNTRVKAPVEEVPPDNIPDETEEKKEEKITKFIENNLKTLRKRSILEDTYLGEQKDVEEAPERRSSLSDTVFSNYETDKSRRPSFLEKLLHHDGEKSLLQNLFGNKSKEDISKKSDESLQNTRVKAPVEEVPPPKKERKPSLFNNVFSRSEKDKTRRASFLENLIFHDGEKSLKKASYQDVTSPEEECVFDNLDFEDKTQISEDVYYKNTTRSSRGNEEKRKRSVTFGGVNEVPYTEWMGLNDHNTNSSSQLSTMRECNLCRGTCLFSTDLFQDVLKSQLLVVTFMNSHSSRLLLGRIINEKMNKCKKKIK